MFLYKYSEIREMENYKYFGMLEAGNIKQTEMKEKVRKEYPRRLRKLIANQTLQEKKIEDCVDGAMQGHEEYVNKCKENLIIAASNNNNRKNKNEKKTIV